VRLIYEVEENGHSLVLDPLVDSPIHGFVLAADHPYREALAAPVGQQVSIAQTDDLHYR
jgi:hypothetical protein